MIGVLLFLAISMCLLAVLLSWAKKNRFIANRVDSPDSGLSLLSLDFPSRQIAERILAEDDWEFVVSTAPATRKMFLRERKAVALLWVREVQKAMAQVMQFHRMAVRQSANLRPEAEIRLAANYLAFSLLCMLLRALIWWQGPFVARRMVIQVTGAAERISFATGQVLASLDPAVLNKMKEGWLNSSLKI